MRTHPEANEEMVVAGFALLGTGFALFVFPEPFTSILGFALIVAGLLALAADRE